MAIVTQIPIWQVFDDNGDPLDGAKLYAYTAGTSTPVNMYTDATSGIPASWPLIFDAAGRGEPWLVNGNYKFILTDKSDSTTWTVDNFMVTGASSGDEGYGTSVDTVTGTNSVRNLDAGVSPYVVARGYRAEGDHGGGHFYWDDNSLLTDDGGAIIKPTDTGDSTAGRWVRIIDGDVNPRWWGAYGNGTNNEETYLGYAILYASSSGRGVRMAEGSYLIEHPMDTSGRIFSFDGGAKIILSTDASSTSINVNIPLNDNDIHFQVDETANAPIFQKGAVVNPKWFGANCDGSTEDSTYLNIAVASLKTNGGTLRILSGQSCKINSTISLFSDVNLIGDGVGSALIADSSSFSGSYVIESYLPDTFCMSRINVSGLHIAIQEAHEVGGIRLNAANSAIRECTITESPYYGILIGGEETGCADVEISDNALLNIGSDASATAAICLRGGTRLTVKNNTVRNTDGTARAYSILNNIFPIEEGDRLSDVVIDGNVTDGGISYLGSSTLSEAATDLCFSNNKVGSFIMLADGSYTPKGSVICDNNIIEIANASGTYENFAGIILEANPVSQMQYLSICNNSIKYKDMTNASGVVGIRIDGTVSNGIISNNTIYSTDGTGIAIHDSSSTSNVRYGVNTFLGFDRTNTYDCTGTRTVQLGDQIETDIGGATRILNRFCERRGSDITASDGTAFSITDGNMFILKSNSGTKISGFDSDGWTAGSQIILRVDGTDNIVFRHDQTAEVGGTFRPIFLGTQTDYTAAPNSVLQMYYDATSGKWFESGRSLPLGVIAVGSDDIVFNKTNSSGVVNGDTTMTFKWYYYEDNTVKISMTEDTTSIQTKSNSTYNFYSDGTGALNSACWPSETRYVNCSTEINGLTPSYIANSIFEIKTDGSVSFQLNKIVDPNPSNTNYLKPKSFSGFYCV